MTAAKIRDLSDEDLKQFMFDRVKSQGLERYLSLLTEESDSDERKMHIRDDEKVDDNISNSDNDSSHITYTSCDLSCKSLRIFFIMMI
jgi:hypothetical protein